MMSKYFEFLRQTDIFYQLAPEYISMIAGLCKEVTLDSGEVIFPEGIGSGELYIILDGTVEIQVNPGLVSDEPEKEHIPVTISTLRRGQSFGEIALVDKGMRSASALAGVDNTRLLVIDRDRLIHLCDDHPVLGYRLMYNLAADLALKMRGSGLRIREELLYSSRSTS